MADMKGVKRKRNIRKKVIAASPDMSQRVEFGDVIILGFTGSLGSGCTFVAEGIKKWLHDTGKYYQLSDVIHKSLEKKGVKQPTIEQLQDEGNDLREKDGVSVLAERCIEQMTKDAFTADSIVLIDGIRNDGEIRCLRGFPNFYLMSVHASEDTRIERLVGAEAPRQRFSDRVEFEQADIRDQEEDITFGQQVRRCNYFADIIINNDRKLIDGTNEKEEFFSHLVHEYVETIKAVRQGKRILDHPPSINETLMTIAYCVSKRSSCQKRNVGAVIARVVEYGHLKDVVRRKEDYRQFQVLSVGYNEVPLGTDPCVLGEHLQCQRDYTKVTLSEKFKHCPNCGEKIPESVKQDADVFWAYSCSKCQTSILKSYLIGGSANSGKLLDVCRALHGEELAIIGLAGRGVGGRIAGHDRDSESFQERLILYTTTYPCNLCANKIVAAGIKEVWYAEPYDMKEAKNILDAGGVDVYKFEGVKSTAYFRLYS